MPIKQDKICVLIALPGEPLVIRSGPTQAQIKTFVQEHNKRARVGEIAGFNEHTQKGKSSPVYAYKITKATIYESEAAWQQGLKGKNVKL